MKEKTVLIFQKSLEYMRQRKVQAAAALLVMILLLIWFPGNWMKTVEYIDSFCAGLYGWVPEISGEDVTFVQEFTPCYFYLDELGVCFRNTAEISGEGTVLFSVSESSGEVLFSRELTYAELADGYYMFEVNLELNKKQSYLITVTFSSVTSGSPAVLLSTTEEYVEENTVFTCNGTVMEGQQLATYYTYYTTYENAQTQDNVVKSVFLILCIALVIAVGCPLKPKQKKAVAYILLLLAPYVLGRRLELLAIDGEKLVENAMAWNVALMYLFELCLCLLIRNPGIALAVSGFFLTLLYSVNYFVYIYRGVSFRFSDLLALKTFSTVAGNYSITPNDHVAMAWLLMITFFACGLAVQAKNTRWNIPCRVTGVLLTAVSLFVLLKTDFLQNQGFERESGMREQITYDYNGYLIATFLNAQVSGMEKPDGYTASGAAQILAEYEEDILLSAGEEEELPNIILVLNESFSDLRVLGNLELSEENLSFFNSLSENTIKGTTNVSVLGGGTANSEFEVFSGCTMGFLSASYYPYFYCFNGEKETLVSQLKKYGYQTFSMHPELSDNWNRDYVYPNIGFETSYWKTDFEDAKIIHSGVSDLETYYKIEEIFENKTSDERVFVFDLTMQNHGGYTYENLGVDITAQNAYSVEANNFLSLIKISDEAFEQLVGYFEDYDEKVIICMFGDHQPLFSDESFYEMIYADTPGLTETDKTLNLYKTPFVIWANYDIEEASDVDISLNYLGVLLMETAGVPLSPYFQYLSELKEDYPVITMNGYTDSEGNYSSWSGDNTEFLDYRILQYHYLFGS